MDEQKFLRLIGVAGLALMIAVLPWGGNLAFGNAGPTGATWYANSPDGKTSLGGGTTGTGHSEICRLTARFIRRQRGNRRQQPGAVYSHCKADYESTCSRMTIITKSGYKSIRNRCIRTCSKPPNSGVTLTSTPLRTTGGQQYLGPVIVAQRDTAGAGQVHQPTAPRAISSSRWTPPSMGPGRVPLVPPEVITPRTAPPSITMGPLRPGSVMGRRTNGLPLPAQTGNYLKGVSFQNVPDMWFDAGGNPVAAGTPGATNDPGARQADPLLY